MSLHFSRAARVSRGVGIVVIVVLVLVGAPIVVHFVGWPPGANINSSSESTSSTLVGTTSSRTSSGSTGGSSISGGLTITNMFADVKSFELQAVYSNFSSFAGKTTFDGSPGETILVVVDIVYQACGSGACPKQITAVDAATSGFAVMSTTPSLPLPLKGAGGDFLEASLTVEVRAPSTPYTGNLTLVVQVS
jgi:hypothetical protein